MKKIGFFISSIFVFLFANAQITEGSVTFERKYKIMISRNSSMSGATTEAETKTSKHKLVFTQDNSVFKALPETETPDPFSGGTNSGNSTTSTMSFSTEGGDTHKDYKSKTSVKSSELSGKNYLVTDSIKQQSWKLVNETKEILGFTCKKAIRYITTRIQNTMTRTISTNGSSNNVNTDTTSKPNTREVEIVAWYAESIPVPAGPDTYDQLPGLILELNYDNGISVYTAVDFSKKVDKKELIAPKKGQLLTAAEFNKLRADLFNQQIKNGGGTFSITTTGQ